MQGYIHITFDVPSEDKVTVMLSFIAKENPKPMLYHLLNINHNINIFTQTLQLKSWVRTVSLVF